jgi:hypothetical protein
VTLAIIGSLAIITGGAVLAILGTDGKLSSGSRLLSTPTSAIAAPVSRIQNTIGIAQRMGTPTLRISASPALGSSATFVGIAPAAAVDRYLAQVSAQPVDDLGFRPYTIRPEIGQGTVHPPTAERFWVSNATSTRAAKLNWKITNTRYQVVIMNANGHRGFATTSEIATTQPNAPHYAAAALIRGLLLMASATALLIRTTGRPRGRPGAPGRPIDASTTATA